MRDGSRFDVVTSAVVLVGYAVPGFLFAILLVVLFAGGSFVQWFPLRGLTSTGSETWSWPGRAICDYLWHMVLPTIALVVGGFAEPDDADQELLPGGDPQAIRRHRARQGAHASSACSTATSSATRCC